MSFAILQPEIQNFIQASETIPIHQLALKSNPFPTVPWIDILSQVEGRQKSKKKLPVWYACRDIVYPSRVSLEQTSSESTAAYKSSLVQGKSMIDLTGGFGVDTYYFSKKMESVFHCEADAYLSSVTAHNFQILGSKNITCIHGDSTKILAELSSRFDWIYIDPSRRNEQKSKVFLLKDCTPHVPELLDFYFRFSDNILIKTAPILDISAGLNELRFVARLHIVAVNNEVKELLWELSRNHSNDIEIKTINLKHDGDEVFSFFWNEHGEATYSMPLTYLYEPNSAIMKSGGFNPLSRQFNVDKLHPHSHLYTSEKLNFFPGRKFRIIKQFPYHKNEMKKHLTGQKANIATRNFPDSVEELRKRWRISDGGDLYCFFTTDISHSKIVLLCEKL